MNVEKAIKILRDTGVGTKLDYRYSAETLNAVKKIAIQALQTQAEREKGCEYCNYKGELWTYRDIDNSHQRSDFCPKCGRPLPEPPKEDNDER